VDVNNNFNVFNFILSVSHTLHTARGFTILEYKVHKLNGPLLIIRVAYLQMT